MLELRKGTELEHRYVMGAALLEQSVSSTRAATEGTT
jgi:hypothetical protein